MVVTTQRHGWRLAAAGLVVVVGGAVVGVAALADDAVDDRVLVVDSGGGVSLLEPSTGNAVYEVADAIATPDRSALLTARSDGASTVLETRDPSTGEVTGSTLLPGDLAVRTVSPRSGAVVLMPGSRPDGLYEPTPRERTSITVAYLDDRESRSYDLPGNIEPEMFSLDESKLFVLEFHPPTAPTSYVVRVLDLATEEITDTESPQVELNPEMSGRARAQALHPDGTFLYTLYTVFDGDARSAFIHVINLEEEWSFCIFLPAPLGTVSESTIGMGVAPDGSMLYVADPSTSTVARVDTAELAIADVVSVPALREQGTQGDVAVARDGTLYLGSGQEVVELEPGTLRLIAAWVHGSPVTALSVSESGTELRIAGGGEVTVLDRATRAEIGVLRAPSGDDVDILGPPRGSVTQIPLECAC